MYSDVYPKKLFKKLPEENSGRRLNPPRVTLPLSFRRASGRGPKRALKGPGAFWGLRVTLTTLGYNIDVRRRKRWFQKRFASSPLVFEIVEIPTR